MKGTNLECDFQYGVGAGDEIQIMCNLEGRLCSPEIRGEECPIREKGESDALRNRNR